MILFPPSFFHRPGCKIRSHRTLLFPKLFYILPHIFSPFFFYCVGPIIFSFFFSRFRLIDSGIVNTRNTAKPHFREKVEKESNCKKFPVYRETEVRSPQVEKKKYWPANQARNLQQEYLASKTLLLLLPFPSVFCLPPFFEKHALGILVGGIPLSENCIASPFSPFLAPPLPRYALLSREQTLQQREEEPQAHRGEPSFSNKGSERPTTKQERNVSEDICLPEKRVMSGSFQDKKK